MFWMIDNFLMRKSRKLWSLSSKENTSLSSTHAVQYASKKTGGYVEGLSDDEVHMHLMADHESNDTLLDERFGSSSESESLFRRNGSESGK